MNDVNEIRSGFMNKERIIKLLQEEFSDIWDCEIDHRRFQNTVGEILTEAVEVIAESGTEKRATMNSLSEMQNEDIYVCGVTQPPCCFCSLFCENRREKGASIKCEFDEEK